MSGILNVLVGAGGGDGSLYAFTDATFTPGTQTGVSGPNLTTARTGLTGTGVDAWKTNTEYFNTSSGIQLWKCPVSGSFTIIAAGAAGGSGSAVAGRGIIIQSTVTLVGGEVYKILIGQKGGIATSSGGGGGTFMTNNSNSAIIVAGGGGGALSGTVFANTTLSDGQSTTSGANSHCGTGTGGASGNGGTGSTNGWGSGGGGLTSNGGVSFYATSYAYTGDGKSFLNGGTGGDSATTATGGFGGGAGTHGSTGGGGGGGGYSGGGGSNQTANPNNGGGGGSYSVNTITTNGYNSGQGYLTITKL